MAELRAAEVGVAADSQSGAGLAGNVPGARVRISCCMRTAKEAAWAVLTKAGADVDPRAERVVVKREPLTVAALVGKFIKAGEETKAEKTTREYRVMLKGEIQARCRCLIRWENGLLEETFRSQDREISALFQRTSQQLSELVLVELHLLPDEVGQMV